MFASEEPRATSYFSHPSTTLDPTLFEGRHLQSWVRQGILTLLEGFFSQHFRHQELWSTAWLAGSGVSYQWSATRQPGDLDCLIGVHYVEFRRANPEYAGLSDTEISAHINELFRAELQPQTDNWNGYELTFYVNPGATDIRVIKPYAAYNITYDEWTVTPNPAQEAPHNSAWEVQVSSDRDLSKTISTRFTSALNEIHLAFSDAQRRNAETRLALAGQQGNALFDEIHSNRRLAFSVNGGGYEDFHNYRWQAAKREGTMENIKKVREYYANQMKDTQMSLYGVELPTPDSLIRKAALYRNQ
jgi:hypothetical protein